MNKNVGVNAMGAFVQPLPMNLRPCPGRVGDAPGEGSSVENADGRSQHNYLCCA